MSFVSLVLGPKKQKTCYIEVSVKGWKDDSEVLMISGQALCVNAPLGEATPDPGFVSQFFRIETHFDQFPHTSQKSDNSDLSDAHFLNL